jgi:hypothetical protein
MYIFFEGDTRVWAQGSACWTMPTPFFRVADSWTQDLPFLGRDNSTGPMLSALLALVNIINIFVGSTGVWTQGSMLASHALSCMTLFILEIGSCFLPRLAYLCFLKELGYRTTWPHQHFSIEVGVLQAFWPQLSCNCRLSLPRVWDDRYEPPDVGKNGVFELFGQGEPGTMILLISGSQAIGLQMWATCICTWL